MVPRIRLELTRLAALGPKPSASTNSATGATLYCLRVRLLDNQEAIRSDISALVVCP